MTAAKTTTLVGIGPDGKKRRFTVGVGMKVRLSKPTRHRMVPAGVVGTVEAVKPGPLEEGGGVTVAFPTIYSGPFLVNGKPEPYRCLFSLARTVPFVPV